MIEAFGESKSLTEWTRDPRCQVGKATLAYRLSSARWTVEDAITTPSGGRIDEPLSHEHIVEAFGEAKGISAWSRDPRCRVSRTALNKRIILGWDPERALLEPKGNRGGGDHSAHRAYRVHAFGESKTLAEWVDDPRCTVTTTDGLYVRLARGLRGEDVITGGEG